MRQLLAIAAALGLSMSGCGGGASSPQVEDGGGVDPSDDGALRDSGAPALDLARERLRDGAVDGALPSPCPFDGPCPVRWVDFRAAEYQAPVAPTCASDLMLAVLGPAQSVIDQGSVPPALFFTEENAAYADALTPGSASFPAMRELVATALAEVALQTYLWEDGSAAEQEILEGIQLLHERCRTSPSGYEPVRLRILINAVSVWGSGLSMGDIMPALAARLMALDLDPDLLAWEIAGHSHLTVGSLHSKTLVVDGRVAVVSGANVQHENDPGVSWMDAGFLIGGKIAEGLLADFADAWSRGSVWTCGSTLGLDCTQPGAWDWYRVVDEPPGDGGVPCRPMMASTRLADVNVFANDVDNPQDQSFLAAFDQALSSIRIETPNLNDDAVKAALLAAVRRGVRVDVVLAKGFEQVSESLPGQGGPNDENVAGLYQTLAGEGMSDRCDRLRIRWYSTDGITPVEGNGAHANHTKFMSIDSRLAIVGSANMDTQSWNHSREVNIVVDDEATTATWESQVFLPHFAQSVVVEPCR